MSWQKYETEARTVLGKLKPMIIKRMKFMDELNIASINFKSIKAQQAKAYDKDGSMSKAALTSILEGDKLVMDAEIEVMRLKNEVEKCKAMEGYLDNEFTLAKKSMDGEIAEVKQFGKVN